MKHILTAIGEFGVKEIAGPANNQRVLKYSTEIGNTWVTSDTDVAWCSEFVNWCLLKSGIKGTNSAVAASFLNWGEELKEPEFGCIVLLGDNGKVNHATFYINELDYDHTKFNGLGGNQSDAVNCIPFSKSRVISYRRVPMVDKEHLLEQVVNLQTQLIALLK